MKQINVDVWCDAHHLKGEQVAGSSLVLNLTGAPRELDLCDPCRETFLDPLVELLKRAGQPVTEAPAKVPAKSRKAGSGRPRVGETAEQAALRRAAGGETYDQALPGLDPSVPFYRPDGRIRCPVCPTHSSNVTALRQHLRARHGVTTGEVLGLDCPLCGATVEGNMGAHTSAVHACDGFVAFDVATEHGDEHGVVAVARHRWRELLVGEAA